MGPTFVWFFILIREDMKVLLFADVITTIALSSQLFKDPECWSGRGSNPWPPPAQQTSTLPTELTSPATTTHASSTVLSPPSFSETSTSRASPFSNDDVIFVLFKDPECWSGRGSNLWPPAQQTGTLRTELTSPATTTGASSTVLSPPSFSETSTSSASPFSNDDVIFVLHLIWIPVN